MNSEAAEQALDIAKRHYNSDNLASAIRFTRKSIALAPSAEATAFLVRLEKAEKAAQSSGTSSATKTSSDSSSSRPTPRASTSRAAPPPEEKREYTPAQAALVKRVKACKVTEYYEILALEKGCSDAEVKKAYRKVSNCAGWQSGGGADSAFLLCSLP
jgi:DnaJ family protein B protein 12